MFPDEFVIQVDEGIFRFDGIDNFEFGPGGVGQGAEPFEVLSADGGEEGVFHRDHVGQFVDLASDIGAHFADKVVQFLVELQVYNFGDAKNSVVAFRGFEGLFFAIKNFKRSFPAILSYFIMLERMAIRHHRIDFSVTICR